MMLRLLEWIMVGAALSWLSLVCTVLSIRLYRAERRIRKLESLTMCCLPCQVETALEVRR